MTQDSIASGADAPNLVALLRARAFQQSNEVIYTLLNEEGDEADQVAFAELDRRARVIGAELQQVSTPGERALLLYPPGLDYIAAFFGCLYAGVVAVPAYPPRPNRPMPRLQAIMAEAQISVALTLTTVYASLAQRAEYLPELTTLRWISTDSLEPGLADGWREPAVDRNTLAFLQYTSGSTSKPKGVMVSHGNLLYNLSLIRRCFGVESASRGVSWLPPYHDMGLIGGLLQPLYSGAATMMMAPVAFLQSPFRWLQAISRYRATINGGPNFAYELCATKITPEQRATLDLSHWEVAFTGAEPIRADTLDHFVAAFAPCGFRREAFYPCYGLAEATLIASGGLKSTLPVIRSFAAEALAHDEAQEIPAGTEGARAFVGCGQNLPRQKIVIADPQTLKQRPPGRVGEIWLAGPSIAQGYWNRAEETEITFRAHLADTGEGPFLRTGDLGFLHAGDLFIAGRIKDLIIIRGRNHYPQDIELTVEQCHPALQPSAGAAFSIDAAGEERLVVVQELTRQGRRADVDQVTQTIRQAVADQHEAQVYAIVLLKPGAIPRTSSGKIQRHACRASFLAETLDSVASSILDPATAPAPESVATVTREVLLAAAPDFRGALLENYLQTEVARVLGVRPTAVDKQQAISALGLDSLMAIELQHTLAMQLGVNVPMVRFLEGLSIEGLVAEALDQLAAAPTPLIAGQTPAAEGPLSYGQRALWFLWQLEPESAAYNVASAVRITAELDAAALQRAFQTLVDRHPALRTVFTLRDGEPAQVIQPHSSVAFSVEDAGAWPEDILHERLVNEAQRPFNLEQGPLFRINVFICSTQNYVVLLAMHHIISDLWSLAVLLREVGQLYQAEKSGQAIALKQSALNYTDYARWQLEQLASVASAEAQSQWDYWKKTLGNGTPPLNLPIDRPRPPVQTARGAGLNFQLDAALTGALKAISQAQGATLYTVLLAAFEALLYRYTGQTDFGIGSPTIGRPAPELAGVIGYFVNPLVLRADCSQNPTFETLLARTRQTVMDSFRHQEFPFALLIEKLQLARDPSRSPLFQVMFAFQKAPALSAAGLDAFALNVPGARLEVGGLPLEYISLEQRTAQFDLTLTMGEVKNELAGSVEYNADLFDADAIGRLVEHFKRLLASAVANPQQRLSGLPLLTPAEQQAIRDWNDTRAAFPETSRIPDLFEQQATQTPEAVAVWGKSLFAAADGLQQITYAELNRRANQLAHYLQQRGVGPEVCVGLCLDRSLELIVSILGVLKAGGAYVPLDPDYPPERLAVMLSDLRAQRAERTQPALVITQQRLRESLPLEGMAAICLEEAWPLVSGQSETPPANRALAETLACVIYTSGSTGQPKGVLLETRSLVNLIHSFITSYQPNTNDRILPLTSLASASFVGEVLPILCAGGTLVLPEKSNFLDFEKLITTIAEQGITILSAVPSFVAGLNAIAERLPRLRLLLSGGEALFANQVDRLLEQATIVNGYGLTETAICSTYHVLNEGALTSNMPVPIGKPVINTQVYILDQELNCVPVGCLGELYIGGEGLARGYLNNPQLTAERFAPNPFVTKDDRRRAMDDVHPSSPEGVLRLYKTGDLARWLPGGMIEYIGRSDRQVKIRGFRVELGDVEAALTQHPAVREAVAIVQEEGANNRRLVGYVALHPEQSCSSDLRAWLANRLPDYMVPAVIVFLAALPFLPNGKVDTRALPAPDSSRPELETAYLAPRSEAEQAIAAIWQEVLGVDKVGVHDNFFDLGGHSLLLVKAHTRLRETFTQPLALVDLFKYPTISLLAKRLSEQPTDSPALDRVQEVAEKQRESRNLRLKRLKKRGVLTDKR